MTECEQALRALLDAVEPLMDGELVQPYYSAWEIEVHTLPLTESGETMHERLKAAYQAARGTFGAHAIP